MLDRISSVLQAVGNFITKQFEKLKEDERLYQEYQDKQKKQMQKQEIHKLIYSMMQKMVYDLFEVFQHQRYTGLEQVRTVGDIRISSYQIIRNTIYYKYKLDKKTKEQLTKGEIFKIINDMNNDISTHAVRLAHQYGQYFGQIFPFLAQGIKVVAVKDLGLDVEITVETAISIQNYYNSYRQSPDVFTYW